MRTGSEGDGREGCTPRTGLPTGNRTRPTAEMDCDHHRRMEIDEPLLFDDSQSSLSELRWKIGVEVPPFVSSNTRVVSLLRDLLDGTVGSVPVVAVSFRSRGGAGLPPHLLTRERRTLVSRPHITYT